MADRRNSNPEPYDTYTSSPLWNDIAGGLNQLGNPLKSIGGRVLNQWNKFGNYLGVNALDIGTDANTPYRTDYPEGNLNFKNKIKGLMNPNFNPQTGRNFRVVSMQLPGQAPPVPNMGNSVGTPAEQKAYREGYITPIPPRPAGPPGGLLNNQQFQDKYGPGQSGLNIGTRVATQKNQEGLFNGTLDKIFKNPVLSRLMEASLYAKPSFQSGFGADVQGMAEGEVALRAVEADEAERISKEAIARAKAGDGRPKVDKTLVNQINRFSKAKSAVDLARKMKSLIPGGVGGPPVILENTINSIGRALGIDVSTSSQEKINAIRAKLVDQFTFIGKDLSATDQKLIDEMLPKTGGLTMSPDKFKFSLNTLISRFENEAIISGNILRQEYGRNPDIYIQKERPQQSVVSRRAG